MRSCRLLLGDILKAIEGVEKSLGNRGRVYFEKDIDAAEATAMRMQIIGESMKKLPERLKKKHEEINWDRFIDFRNFVSHQYHVINKDILWSAKDELSHLKKVIRRMIDEE